MIARLAHEPPPVGLSPGNDATDEFWQWMSLGFALVALMYVSRTVRHAVDAATAQLPWTVTGSAPVVALALGSPVLVAVIVDRFQPRQVGNSLTIVLVVWRALRFVYQLLAALAAVWMMTVAWCLAWGLHQASSDRSSGFSFDLILYMFGAAIFMGGTIRATAPAVIDLVRGLEALGRVLGAARWRRRQAPRLSTPLAPPVGTGTVDILVVSDLHAVAEGDVTIEGDLDDTAMLAFVRETARAARPRLVIAAGDLTDTGKQAAWDKVAALFADLGAPVCAAPGNHDVNFRGFSSRERPWKQRMRLFLNLDELRAESGSFAEPVLAENIGRVIGEPHVEFPLLRTYDDVPVSVLVLNSNRRPSNSPITNALGYVGRDQLAAAARRLQGTPNDRCLLIVIHHHLFAPDRDSLVGHVGGGFLVCTDAPDVLRFALEHRATALIHGHQHMPYVRIYRDGEQALPIISVGSAMYPAKGPCAAEVGGPSIFGLRLRERELEVSTFRRHAIRAADAQEVQDATGAPR